MANEPSLRPADELVDRFSAGINVPPDARLGVAVSGGPDSLALLLLAAAAIPGRVEAATVDHGLRAESRVEAEMVAALCARLEVPHEVLTVEWDRKPDTGIQARARTHRYRQLDQWGRQRDLAALATAHHVEDQAETFLMRLARGAGVRGLSAMRPVTRGVASMPLVRPLLGWRRSELEQICAAAGLTPATDPSNEDEQFERVRVRHALAEADWLDPAAIARSARNLAQADVALHWATDNEWARAVTISEKSIVYRLTDAPHDIRRRIARRSVLRLASEGGGTDLRGRELDRLVSILASGKKATLRGVLCTGDRQEWRFVPAPNRSRPVDNLR